MSVGEKELDEALLSLQSFNGSLKVKLAAMNMMVKQISDDEFKDLKKVFNKLDKDQSGTID